MTSELNINTFIWLEKREQQGDEVIQKEKNLIDMTSEELNNFYEHCKKMLYNQSSETPGRYVVLTNISDQKDRCGVELFLRWLDKEREMSRYSLLQTLNVFIENNKELFKNNQLFLDNIFNGVPDQFLYLPITLVMDGCLDRLGVLNKKHITRKFILKQGIWLTNAESKEFADINPKDRIQHIRELLQIKPVEKLYINDKGLNYTQMRSMLTLRPNKKYNDLTTNQLETLRYKMLFILEEDVKKHIYNWGVLMDKIEIVAEVNNITLSA